MKVTCMNVLAVGAGGAGANMVSGRKMRISQKNTGLKSTQEKIGRQERANSQIGFWENQIENLKNIKCDTIEDIARKLEIFHRYEDEIAVVKAAYNSEQIWHVMDEAREMGEKIAEAVEKMEPKTPEERKEEMQEEVSGIEKGILSEIVDEFMDSVEELEEEKVEEMTGTERKALEEKVEEMTETDIYKEYGLCCKKEP